MLPVSLTFFLQPQLLLTRRAKIHNSAVVYFDFNEFFRKITPFVHPFNCWILSVSVESAWLIPKKNFNLLSSRGVITPITPLGYVHNEIVYQYQIVEFFGSKKLLGSPFVTLMFCNIKVLINIKK